jgi:two-component system OmpR family sensor kinase
VIEVSDSGLGVPPEALPRIFDRWARADGARTRERGGAGLGLPIVAAVARGHGGRCSVKPLPRGTAFRLHLPVRVGPDQAPSPTPASEGGAGAGPEPALSEDRIALG